VNVRKRGRHFWLDLWVGKKRVRRSLHTDEYRLALERARDIATDLRDRAKRTGLPFAAFSAQYLEWARQAKPASWRTESYEIAFIKSWLDNAGLLNLEDITPHHVEQLRLAVRAHDRRTKGEHKREASKATANRYLALLRAVFNRARD